MAMNAKSKSLDSLITDYGMEFDVDQWTLLNLQAKKVNDKKKAAVAAIKQKNLDQLALDYGMESEFTAIDMNRPVPFNGYGAYGSGFDYGYGEFTPEFFGAAAPQFVF